MVTNKFIFGFPFFEYYSELMDFHIIIYFKLLQSCSLFAFKLVDWVEWKGKKPMWTGIIEERLVEDDASRIKP